MKKKTTQMFLAAGITAGIFAIVLGTANGSFGRFTLASQIDGRGENNTLVLNS